MLAYGYDEQGYFTGAGHCQPDPLVPGNFLVPGSSTLEPIPAFNPMTEEPMWDGTEWQLVPSRVYLRQQEQQAAEAAQAAEVAAAAQAAADEAAAKARLEVVRGSYNEFGVLTKEEVEGVVVLRDTQIVESETLIAATIRMRRYRDEKIALV